MDVKIFPPGEQLAPVNKLVDEGLLVQAHRRAVEIGPLDDWSGRDACILAGRLAGNLESRRLANAFFHKAHLAAPSDADACSYMSYVILERRGPLAALRFLQSSVDLDLSTVPGRTHVLSALAHSSAVLRDFEQAEGHLKAAFGMEPESPWLLVTQSYLREMQDRYEEALESAKRALEVRPWYRPAVLAASHVLQLFSRDDEALDLLSEASRRLEVPAVHIAMADIHARHQRFQQELECFDRFEELALLLEEPHRLWLKNRRITAACKTGDLKTALDLSKTIAEPYYRDLSRRLGTAGKSWKKALLDVPFVRQHHLTCAPATLASLGLFWRKPVDHLELAGRICYDGTPSHSERQWAEDNGWHVREFTVTWDSAVSLIDRGVPFAVATAEATSGHMQALVGYDELRRTFLLRDPSHYDLREVIAAPFLERYRSSGPRALAVVPQDSGGLLEGIELPESAQYDNLHAVNRALHLHDRLKAGSLADSMRGSWPRHRLTLMAGRAVAAYDSNTTSLYAIHKELSAMFPEDTGIELARIRYSRNIEPRNFRLEELEKACRRPYSDPVLWLEYVRELNLDGRQIRNTKRWMRLAMRYRPVDAETLKTAADVLWTVRDFDEAARYYRAAACIEDTKEYYSQSYFSASRFLEQTEASLTFLKSRFKRLGILSSNPAITLADSLFSVDAVVQAFEIIDEAQKLRPDDGDLQLYAADACMRYERLEQAAELLKSATGRSLHNNWLRTAARMASYGGDRTTALKHWREATSADPLAMDARSQTALLLAETTGRASAVAYLDYACALFPNHCELQRLRIEWLRDEPPEVLAKALSGLLSAHPTDAWARRELAFVLSRLGRNEEAMKEAELAISLEPGSSFGYSTRGRLHLKTGAVGDARADYLKALSLDVDNGFASNELVSMSATLEEKKGAVEALRRELARQTSFGEAVTNFRAVALGILPQQELLSALEEIKKDRPDLWQSWSVVIEQQRSMKTPEAALQTALEATQRFPTLPRLWLDLSIVKRDLLDDEGEFNAVKRAYDLNPMWDLAAGRLAEEYERRNDPGNAIKVMERACANSPLEAINFGVLASYLWENGRKPEAVEKLQHALKLDPCYEWGWSTLGKWGAENGRPDLAVAMARDLVARNEGDARSWIMLAKALANGADAGDEKLAALDKAVSIDPGAIEACDMKAELLALMGRFEEALECCRPKGGNGVPVLLKVREAWVESRRGGLKDSIPKLKNILVEHPDYRPGWNLLADWCWQAGKHDEAVEAAGKIVQFAPSDPVPLGYLGDMKQHKGDVEGAKDAFRRAFKLDPNYTFAGFELFKILRDFGEFQEAEDVLKRLEGRAEAFMVQGGRVSLLSRRIRRKETFDALATLCRMKLPNAEGLISACNEAASRFGLSQTVKFIKKIVFTDPSADECVAEAWIALRSRQGRRAFPWRTSRLNGKSWTRAAVRYLDEIGTSYSDPDIFARASMRMMLSLFIFINRGKILSDTAVLGQLGYALRCQRRDRRLAAEYAGWTTRKDLEPWMLNNYVQSLQHLGREKEISEVLNHVLGKFDGRQDIDRFKLWSALYQLAKGRADDVRKILRNLPFGRFEGYDRIVYEYVTASMEVLESEKDGRQAALKNRGKIKSFIDLSRGIRSLRRAGLEIARVIGKKTDAWDVLRISYWEYYKKKFSIAAVGLAIVVLVVIKLAGGK